MIQHPQISDLQIGMDFRKPETRREVFMRFYKFNLKYNALPGCVYYLLPHFAKKFNWTKEQQYWFAFINGCTQNPCTSWAIFNAFPDFEKIDEWKLEDWHRANWKNLDYDIDRRYQKGHFVTMWHSYKECLDGLTQQEFFEGNFQGVNPIENFKELWECVTNNFFMFGRLSTFSYLEYLKIIGLEITCHSLFLEDLAGSKSHRNGLCNVLGRDDNDWHKSNPTFVGHSPAQIEQLNDHGLQLLKDARTRFKNEPFIDNVNYFTLESCLCSYKGMFRARRYPNVYNDMLYDRIIKAEKINWHHCNFDEFWQARKENLPAELLCENQPIKGLSKEKQNWFVKTGEIIHMDIDDKTFKNNFKNQISQLTLL